MVTLNTVDGVHRIRMLLVIPSGGATATVRRC